MKITSNGHEMKIMLLLALVLSGGLFNRNASAAIVFPQAPEGGKQIAYTNAAATLKFDPHCLGGFRIEELTIADPCRDYSIGLTNLASGLMLTAAEVFDWRYLFMHGTNVVGEAHLSINRKAGNALVFSGLGTSLSQEMSQEMERVLRLAERLPQIKAQDYEFRHLDSPAILFHAIWLYGKSDDIIIPVGNSFGRWNAYQPYTESQLLKLLKPVARKKLKEPPGTLD